MGDRLKIRRRSLQAEGAGLEVTRPDGTTAEVQVAGGAGAAEMPVDQPGLWRVSDGRHVALAAAGTLNPLEMSDLRATPEKLKPVVEASGGGWRWIVDGLPELHRTGLGSATAGPGWFGLRANGERVVTSVRDIALAPAWLMLILGFGGLVLTWWRER